MFKSLTISAMSEKKKAPATMAWRKQQKTATPNALKHAKIDLRIIEIRANCNTSYVDTTSPQDENQKRMILRQETKRPGDSVLCFFSLSNGLSMAAVAGCCKSCDALVEVVGCCWWLLVVVGGCWWLLVVVGCCCTDPEATLQTKTMSAFEECMRQLGSRYSTHGFADVL